MGPHSLPPLTLRMRRYLERVSSLDMGENRVGVFSAHQMSSNRMGTDPSTSVVDEDGELWECDGLYLCDASVLPTASGANPMMSVLTTSTMLMTRLADKLALDDGKLKINSTQYTRAAEATARRSVRREKVVVGTTASHTAVKVAAVGAVALGLYFWVSQNSQASTGGI